jgi:hypothetical protein
MGSEGRMKNRRREKEVRRQESGEKMNVQHSLCIGTSSQGMLDVHKVKRRTSNIQRPTSNVELKASCFFYWKLKVGRSMLDVHNVKKTNVEHSTPNIEH